MKRLPMLLIMVLLVFLYGCAENNAATQTQPDYDTTKKMVVDILQTEEGKKAIEGAIKDDKIKEKMIMDQTFVAESIQKSLTSKEAEKFWKKNFEDPKFAAAFAQGIKKEHEKLIKDLMKDPEYQGSMMDILKNPEMEKELSQILKGKKFREELQKLMQETFDSPLFKVKLQKLLLENAEELNTQGGKEKQGGSQGGGGSGGTSGGGGGSSGSGG